MPARDLLRRFRPVAAPGAVGPVGVPADDEEDAATELAPIFNALGPVLIDCAEARSQAESAAAEEVANAEREANRLVAEATALGPAERAAAAAQIRSLGDAAADRLVADAEREAARLERIGEQRLTALVAKTIAQLRIELLTTSEGA